MDTNHCNLGAVTPFCDEHGHEALHEDAAHLCYGGPGHAAIEQPVLRNVLLQIATHLLFASRNEVCALLSCVPVVTIEDREDAIQGGCHELQCARKEKTSDGVSECCRNQHVDKQGHEASPEDGVFLMPHGHDESHKPCLVEHLGHSNHAKRQEEAIRVDGQCIGER